MFTDFGMIEPLPGETDEQTKRRAYENWERAAFDRGGWHPLTRARFEELLTANQLGDYAMGRIE